MIAENGFGTLVTTEPGAPPMASSLPFVPRPDRGILLGHLARANAQFEILRGEQSATVLVIFQGPSGFVSGGYYDEPCAVPTWDHVTVHVTGSVQLIHGETATLRLLQETVAHFEDRAGSNWRLDVERSDLPELVAQVAGFTVAIERVESIFKLSQNVSREQRRRVVTGLLAHGHHDLVNLIQAEDDRRLEATRTR